jgi:hypothetical protein
LKNLQTTMNAEEQNFVLREGRKESKKQRRGGVGCVELCPPDAFVFEVGEYPSLPLFGRHFKRCESKISGPCYEAKPVLQAIHEVICEYFPGQTFFYDEGHPWEQEEGYIMNNNESEFDNINFDSDWHCDNVCTK